MSASTNEGQYQHAAVQEQHTWVFLAIALSTWVGSRWSRTSI